MMRAPIILLALVTIILGSLGCRSVMRMAPGYSTERGWHAGPWQQRTNAP